MGINIGVIGYSDFKIVVNSLPEKVNLVYYHNNPSGGFFVVAITQHSNYVIGASDNPGIPSTFNTDFPNAIALNSSPVIVSGNTFGIG
jgi:hypothetical protein